jgi:hypothetical protein
MANRIAVLVALALQFSVSGFAQSTVETQAPEGQTVPSFTRINVELGAQTTILDSTDRWSKFMEHRDIPSNFVLPHVDFTIDTGGPWSLRGAAEDAAQLDARYSLSFEKFGKWRNDFRYVSLPSFAARLVTAPYNEQSSNFFTLPTTIRGSLQLALPEQVPGIINDFLANTPSQVPELRTRYQRFSYSTEFGFAENWMAFAELTYDRRSGHRYRGLGSYERLTTPAGGVFNVLGDELPERVDDRATEFRAGISRQTRNSLIRFEYVGSFYSNESPVLRWENPLSAIDQSATPPTPNTGGGANRWRFATGQLQRNPDNQAHTIAVTAKISGLPLQSFAAASLSYSRRTQDEPFLPTTLNTALIAPSCDVTPTYGCLPAGVTPTSLDALPRPSLEGEVNIINGDLVVGRGSGKTCF